MTGGRGETRWVPGDTMQKKSTEPGVGPSEAPVYNPLFLVQLCADTPFSRRPLALTRSGHNTWRGSCRDSHLRSYPYYRHSSFCPGDHAFRQMQEPPAGPEHPQYYPPPPTSALRPVRPQRPLERQPLRPDGPLSGPAPAPICARTLVQPGPVEATPLSNPTDCSTSRFFQPPAGRLSGGVPTGRGAAPWSRQVPPGSDTTGSTGDRERARGLTAVEVLTIFGNIYYFRIYSGFAPSPWFVPSCFTQNKHGRELGGTGILPSGSPLPPGWGEVAGA